MGGRIDMTACSVHPSVLKSMKHCFKRKAIYSFKDHYSHSACRNHYLESHLEKESDVVQKCIGHHYHCTAA